MYVSSVVCQFFFFALRGVWRRVGVVSNREREKKKNKMKKSDKEH